jgi:hypothetical protein
MDSTSLCLFSRPSLAIVNRLYRLDPEAVMVQDYLNDFLSIKLANQHTHRWKSF